MAVWSDGYRTPRYVWSASAIAATLLHAGGIWWAISAWQQHRSTPASPIEVIAIPDPAMAAVSPSPEELPPLPPVPPQPFAPEPEPAPPSNLEPFAEAVPNAVAPVDTVPETAPPRISPAPEPLPRPSPEAIAPPPSPPSPSPTPQPSPQPAPQPPPAPSPPAEPPSAPLPGGMQTTWSLSLVPQGRDLPDELPQLPPGWETRVFSRDTSTCFPRGLPPLTAARVTVRLTVEADGTISQVRPWESSGNPAYDALVQCLIQTQLSPLTPATTGGTPIPTDMVLLTVFGSMEP